MLVGTAVPGACDQRATPVAEVCPGTVVHANLLSGLLEGRLPVLPSRAAGFEIAQRLLICAALAASLLLTALFYGGITLRGFATEGRQRRPLVRLFGSYVPPELVAEMACDPARYDMRAENRVLTAMFRDMRNFTRVSEKMSPEDLRALMNRFFFEMTVVFHEHRRTLDKYIGDAIMAFWARPSKTRRIPPTPCRRCSRWASGSVAGAPSWRGLSSIGVGIGLNTGLVCVGGMVSSMRRSDTVMGEAVNLASRIEARTRHCGVEVLAGRATRDETSGEARGESCHFARPKALGGIVWVEIDRVRIKGKNRDVTFFTPLSATLAGIPMFQDEMRLRQLALASHRRQHWDEAQAHLQQLRSGCADSPLTGLCRQFDQRIVHQRIASPPADRDGAHTFDSK